MILLVSLLTAASTFASDIPDQTIASWTAEFHSTGSFLGPEGTNSYSHTYKLFTTSGVLVIESNYKDNIDHTSKNETYRINLSDVTNFEANKDVTRMITLHGKNFKKIPKDEDYDGEDVQHVFADDDRANYDLVQERLKAIGIAKK